MDVRPGLYIYLFLGYPNLERSDIFPDKDIMDKFPMLLMGCDVHNYVGYAAEFFVFKCSVFGVTAWPIVIQNTAIN